ncbi:MAG: hypothetical protein M1480_18030 [Bacteroidetes bacterium]|nr:hypothetical protein [Bacteroidota bacterium]
MKKLLPFLFFPVIIFLAGCAHTNELAKYDLSGKGILFSNHVSANASKLQFVNHTPAKQEKEKSDVLSAIASIGSDILSESSKSKITDAVSTDSIASYVSEGLKNALIIFLKINPVNSVNENPQFVVETTIDKCQLVTGTDHVSISVQASSRIIDRNSGNIVWDDNETETVPVEENYANDKDNSSTLNKVISAVQLSSLSEKEIQKVVNEAAKNAGRKIGETFREDVIKLKNK